MLWLGCIVLYLVIRKLWATFGKCVSLQEELCLSLCFEQCHHGVGIYTWKFAVFKLASAVFIKGIWLTFINPKWVFWRASLATAGSLSTVSTHVFIYEHTPTSQIYGLLWWSRFYTSYHVCCGHTFTWTHTVLFFSFKHSNVFVLFFFFLIVTATESAGKAHKLKGYTKCSYLIYLHGSWTMSCGSQPAKAVLEEGLQIGCPPALHHVKPQHQQPHRLFKRDALNCMLVTGITSSHFG